MAVGKDDFLESEFRLRDNTHRVYALDVNATPTERVVLGARTRTSAITRCRDRLRRILARFTLVVDANPDLVRGQRC